MKITIRHGAIVDVPTAEELAHHLTDLAATPARTTIRAAANLPLDASGDGIVSAFTVPPGYEFMLRRLAFNLSSATDSFTGAVQLGVAGVWIKLLRSGTLIEYSMPVGPTTHIQVPGVQSWSEVEGPYLSNGEELQIQANGLTASADLNIEATGLLVKPDVQRPR